MIDALDIATMPIADKVQRHLMASYYALQLDALQAEAKRLGYFFARADTAATMPPVLADRLAWATEYRRMVYQNPNVPEKWVAWMSGSMSDGYPQEHLRSMLAALAALGIRLQVSPQAGALLAAEECRQREQAGLPPEPRPLLGVEVSGFDSGLFDKIDEPKEDHPA
jgi:hypothetical protein